MSTVCSCRTAYITAAPLQGCIAAVHTNPAAFEGGVLHVRPHSAEPHLCDSICPDNMCKGQVLPSCACSKWHWQALAMG